MCPCRMLCSRGTPPYVDNLVGGLKTDSVFAENQPSVHNLCVLAATSGSYCTVVFESILMAHESREYTSEATSQIVDKT